MALLKQRLSACNWSDVYNAQSPEDAYNTLIGVVTMEMNAACPIRKTRKKYKKNLADYNDERANELKENFLKSLRTYEITGQQEDKEIMTHNKKCYDLRLREVRQEATNKHIRHADNKSKAIWDVINSEKASKRGQKAKQQFQLITAEGETNDPQEISEKFNNYFCSIAEETLRTAGYMTPQTLQMPSLEPAQQTLTLTPTTPLEVKEIIGSLKNKGSCGLDDISSTLTKCCGDIFAPLLAEVINKSFEHGIFPTAMKTAKVYPKLKKGSSTEMGNYRPISNLPTFSKIVEKIVLRRLLDHLNKFNLIPENQHGFLKGRSTTTALTALIEYIIDQIDNNLYTAAILLDYSKAFDCLGHQIILNKLKNLGIEGITLCWFKSYLEGRSQLVEVKHTSRHVTQTVRSKCLPATRGVPQGSVLGPVLFILLTHDFPNYIKDYSTAVMYADDTTLLCKGNTAEELSVNAYISLNMTYDYCASNDLAANPQKTKQISFGRRREQIPVLPDVSLEEESKLLGLTLDANLTWGPHINELCKKLNSAVYVVRRLKQISSTDVAKVAYHSLLETHLRYGIVIWGATSVANLNRVLIIQKTAIRSLAELDWQASCREAFKQLKIKTVIAIYIQEVILLVDKNGLPRETKTHSHNTRNTKRIPIPRHRTTLFEKKPTYIGTKLYNLLPDDIRALTGAALKHRLDTWLTDQPLYSIQEFYDLVGA